MPSRAAELILALDLAPHPEGGHFREIHRSADVVDRADGRGARAALTVIYFLLAAGETSRWHRVASDEAWLFLEGDPLELMDADSRFDRVDARILGPFGPGAGPAHVVRSGRWQAARSTGAYTLASCAVGPGFEYADFEMLRDRRREADALRSAYPAFAAFL